MNFKQRKMILHFWVISTAALLFLGTSSAIDINENNINTVLPTNSSRETYTFNPTDDSYIGAPDEVNGFLTTLNLRNGSGGDYFLAAPAIKFDISSIPEDVSIISATLYVYYNDYTDNSPAGRPLTMRHFESDWNEETLNRNNMPPYSNEISSTTNAPSSPGVWVTWNVQSDVQKFLSGTINNYGWIIKDEQYWGGSSIPLMFFCSKEYGNNIPYLKIVVNSPPEKPQITGEMNGKVGKSYDYIFIISDSEEDQMYLTIDWGDGQTNNWIGPYSSGQPITIPHYWSRSGNYTIKAKAKDIYNAESDWGILQVTMPCSYSTPTLPFWESLFERFPNAFPILRYWFGY